ncbi:hypothetical protein EG68_00381 [Paragonimus skrjabini miyazakii]|uniref:SBF1/SBF2 domain-containing protein n=1 Tax=Paragonimus skrjabini miyazakii TaxID=59628 RepID=A0A8S9Z9S9_9TREM|nr:hypothetical protein EG68_00381 [Paragonimus skrjabini miyazakii]
MNMRFIGVDITKISFVECFFYVSYVRWSFQASTNLIDISLNFLITCVCIQYIKRSVFLHSRFFSFRPCLFCTHVDPSRSTERTSLFSYIKTQPIWHTLRFWNACFFQSVQEARAKLAEKNQSDKRPEEIVFDQLKSYLNTMNVFELHTTIKQEFLRKHSGLFNLTDGKKQHLNSFHNRLYDHFRKV